MAIRLAVIAGPEAYELMRQGLVRGERRYAMNTPFGEAQPVYQAAAAGQTYLFLPRQGDAGSRVAPSAVNYRANVYALKELGAQAILSWTGPAALASHLPVGRLVLPDDLIDLTRGRKHTFFEHSPLGRARQAPVFCPELRRVCEQGLKDLDLEATQGGTYVCTEGPRLETLAEVRLLASWGGTLVGQTLCPEVFLARELAICYAPLCFVTGHAEGLAERRFVSGRLYQGLADEGDPAAVEAAAGRFPQVIEAVLRALATGPDDWPCRRDLLADRDPDLLTRDWHDWLGD